jgi:hypothetical protein
MEKSLNVNGNKILDKSMIEFVYVDRDIQWDPKTHQDVDLEPLLVNKVDTWKLRPEATTKIPNFFLASDYIQTNTDLATMEGANEAARRAVNGILEKDNSSPEPCTVWPLSEPWLFTPLKNWDQKRFEKGEEYSHDLPLWLKAFMVIWGDTVNTASRIESNGKVGRVNISESTYQLLKEDTDFTFEIRGEIEAKGKGMIKMYFIGLKK